MITNSESNPVLTEEQQKAIELTTHRLFVLETEISVATKVLGSLRNDSIKASKDKSYQEELLLSISSQVSEGTNKLNSLNETVVKQSELLSSISQEIAQKSTSLNEKEDTLKDREDMVSKKEEEIFERQEILTQKELVFEEKEERFNKRVDKINKAIND